MDLPHFPPTVAFNFEEFLKALPSNYAELAYQYQAFARSRKIKSPAQLLQVRSWGGGNRLPPALGAGFGDHDASSGARHWSGPRRKPGPVRLRGRRCGDGGLILQPFYGHLVH
jgi:hypothetical protein